MSSPWKWKQARNLSTNSVFSEKSHMLALFGFYILLYRDVEKYYMKIKKSNGELITEVGDTLTNYIPAVKAVVK